MKKTLFMKQLATYFESFLPIQKKCSKNTSSAYAYGFTIFFEFMEEKKSKQHQLIEYSDLTPQLFDEYILWMQIEKGYRPSTQKQRMAALTSFLKYASRREMSAISAFNNAIDSTTETLCDSYFSYFTAEEIKEILLIPNCKSATGRRDRVLLSLLYDSAARAQEICDLRVSDLTLKNPAKVLLNGKGNKSREVPISNDVVKLIRQFLKEQGKSVSKNNDDYLFSSQREDQMTTACIRHLVKKYVTIAKQNNPTLFRFNSYSPHSFRHSKAMHMLEANTPLIYIRNFLGHESVKTTEIYARVSQAGLTQALKNHSSKVQIPSMPKNTSVRKNTPAFLEKYK